MNSIYTSTGKKILRHLSYLQKFQSEGIINPISLQIAPTSRCNLNCVFCSNKNRAAHEDLDYSEMIRFVKSINPKTIEWTGGGDPTQYKYIADAIRLFHSWGIKQGFITNGIDLAETVGTNVVYLEWVRVSLNSLDYIKIWYDEKDELVYSKAKGKLDAKLRNPELFTIATGVVGS